MIRKASVALAVSVMAVWGCERGGPGDPDATRAALRSIEGCEDLEVVLRASAIDQMRAEVLANYEATISGEACEYYPDGDADTDTDSDTDTDADGDGDADADLYSTTNTQEEGVDEADFIKNDGSYIYMVSGMEFLIIDAWPAAESSISRRSRGAVRSAMS